MKHLLAAGLLLLLPGSTARAQPQEPEEGKVIDLRAVAPLPGNSFEALWGLYRKAEGAGDTENAQKAFDEIRRLRIERNIRNLEEVGLALVAVGFEDLQKGERDKAELELRRAMVVAPQLPDAYLGLAVADVKKGPIGILSSVREVARGLTTRLSTSRGQYYLLTLLVGVGFVTALVTVAVLALAFALRYGTLLLHDLEESFGPGRRALALAVYAVLLLLPLATFQGYGWLPLWWLALLFAYASKVERGAAVGAVLLAALVVGPVARVLEARVKATQNPLFRASMLAIEGGPDRRAIAALEAAMKRIPEDRDLGYLLGLEYKKAGLYDEAAALYKEMLRANEKDAVALNNLGNLEFAQAEFPAAITRYKLAAEGSEGLPTGFLATVYYNMSLAYYQKFDRQPADEARSQADRLSSGLTRAYDALWKYEEKNENAVVDLGLSPGQVWAKFSGTPEGVGRQNMTGRTPPGLDAGSLVAATLNRFGGFVGVFVLTILVLGRWRGPRMFTMRCQKCGTPFCKRCHLGASPAGLCTQCYHLFVVRDGVSGPARNQKLLEVQKEDERRERIFRALSLLSPGAGHLYAQKTLAGLLLAAVWYALLALCLLAGRVLPVTEAPSVLADRWALAAAALLLLVVYVVANRARPDFEVALPIQRGPRRGRAA